MRYITIDSCKDADCHCEHRNGIILYDGPSLEEATEAKTEARYPDPVVEIAADRTNIQSGSRY